MYNTLCPSCKREIHFEYKRWNLKMQCSNCKSYLLFDFDMIYDQELNEEFDVPTMILLKDYQEFLTHEFTQQIECNLGNL